VHEEAAALFAPTPFSFLSTRPFFSSLNPTTRTTTSVVTNNKMRALSISLALTKLAYLTAAAGFDAATARSILAVGATGAQTGASAVYKLGSEYGPVIAIKGKELATEYVPKAASAATSWAQQNPGLAAVGATGAVIVAAPGLVAVPVLSAVGFGSGGVGAGTIAAGAQAGIGNVAAGSWFATLTSAGMGGTGALAVNGIVQAGGAAMTASGGVLAWAKARL